MRAPGRTHATDGATGRPVLSVPSRHTGGLMYDDAAFERPLMPSIARAPRLAPCWLGPHEVPRGAHADRYRYRYRYR